MRFVADPRCPRHPAYDVLPVFREVEIPVWECMVCRRPLGAASATSRTAHALRMVAPRRPTHSEMELARPRPVPVR
jgi:uncharacterized metal-binding protein (TIGR02443 family)